MAYASFIENHLQANTKDFPDWLEQIPGQPSGTDPDRDGVPSFMEYALGGLPEDAIDPFKYGSSPVFQREDETKVWGWTAPLNSNGLDVKWLAGRSGRRNPQVLLPFAGKRDMIYLLESKASLKDTDWTTLARKLGNAPWQSVAESFEINETSENVTLSYENWPDATFLRLRVEGDEGTLQRKAMAARFLKQATFGPTMAQIEALANTDLNFEGWIDDQIALPATSHLAHYYSMGLSNSIDPREIRDEYKGGAGTLKVTVWWDVALLGEDQLRQRMAWALSQIFVMGELGSKANQYPIQWVNWYDILVNNAFGNFRNLLQDVTLSPKMGDYLTYVGNRKANGDQLPDENYAREVMQLFTIGLWHLNSDGTLKLDEQGEPIPTYTNYHITELAKVFTGLIRQVNKPNLYWNPNRVDPMRENNNRHDRTAKEMFDGSIIPAGGNTIEDISLALDVLFNHSNTAPFIAYRLIQRLTCSNPSPEYVERVANAFIDNGDGERGDLAAVCKAILLDPEARDAGYAVENGRGKLREPMLKFTQICRAFNIEHNAQNPHFWIRSMDDDFGMSPYRYPSVFNFYLPEFFPQGEIQDASLVAPEFQILDDSTGLKTFRIFNLLINNGLSGAVALGNAPRPQLDYSEAIPLTDDVPELIAYLDLLLTHQTLKDETKDIIKEAVEAVPGLFAEARVKRAVVLISLSPEFAILE